MGDLIAVLELANKIRKEFADAPSQFKAISDEYVSDHDGSLSGANYIMRIGFEASTSRSNMSTTSYRDWSLTFQKRRF